VDAELLLLDDLAGAYTVESLDPPGLTRVAEVCRRYRDLELGLADGAAVVIADRRGTNLIATFDERHFRAVAPLGGGAFRLLPTDA
jgi:predicted nucleic acid-binding protein